LVELSFCVFMPGTLALKNCVNLSSPVLLLMPITSDAPMPVPTPDPADVRFWTVLESARMVTFRPASTVPFTFAVVSLVDIDTAIPVAAEPSW
jgi:hypothetical protein